MQRAVDRTIILNAYFIGRIAFTIHKIITLSDFKIAYKTSFFDELQTNATHQSWHIAYFAKQFRLTHHNDTGVFQRRCDSDINLFLKTLILWLCTLTGFDISTRQLAMASANFVLRVRPESQLLKWRGWNFGGNILCEYKIKVTRQILYALRYLYQSHLFQISFISIDIDKNCTAPSALTLLV